LSVKMFTFNASSFALDPAVENFLKSKGAIAIDFGVMEYVNSEAMPAILSELVERSKPDAPSDTDLVAQLKAEISRFDAEKQEIMEDNVRLASELGSHSTEVAALKEKVEGAAKVIESLKVENIRLRLALKSVQHAAPAAKQAAGQSDKKLRQSYEKLQEEFQQLRSQSVEAITSLKVLEDENEELRQELEQLKNQQAAKSTSALKAA
jgi:regulator of replication initiation timing